MELRVNPDGCQRFEANIFRRERCKHCGHPWHAHLGAIDADQLARFQSSRASGGGGSGSGPSGKAKAKPKAARAEWLFEDADEGGSGSDGEFRMLAGEDLELVARPRSSSSSVKIVNLVDFGECNPPTREGRLASASSDASHSSSRGAAPGFTMPMRSKGDVLLEEVHFLRQMLADSNEEKRIQVAIVRDEVAEKQRVIDELRHQAAVAEARLQALRTSGEVVHVVSVRGSLQGWEEAKQQAACLKQRCDELEAAGKQQEAEVVRLKGKLDFWEASEESLADLSSEPAVVAWDSALREATQRSLQRLADRRLALRVASCKEVTVCKICYDRQVSCALLPCRHHAFCTPCAERVEQSRDQACPICRTAVTGRFETFIS